MNQSDVIALYEITTTLLSVSMLIVTAIMFRLQLRAYRHTHHRSLEPLLVSTALAGGHVLLSMAAQYYWSSGAWGFYLFLLSLPLAFAQMALATYGTAKLLRAFEERTPVGDTLGA